MTSLIILAVVYYIVLVPVTLFLSFRMRPLYKEVGADYPFWLHLWIALIPVLGVFLLFALLQVEAHNYQLWKEREALEEYRESKEGR